MTQTALGRGDVGLKLSAKFVGLLFILALLGGGGVPLAAQFTVQEALSAPFCNQLTAAPAKARVAWFTDQEGHRNIWVAGVREPARPVTDNTADDGQDIDDITWSRDGERLAWTRGTGQAGSEHTMAANPAELPGQIQQHLEWVDLREEWRGHRPPVHIVQDGHSPLITANGNQVLFLRRGSIWMAALTNARTANVAGGAAIPGADAEGAVEASSTTDATRQEPSVHQVLSVRGTARGLRLSPDGEQLAFVSERGDHSFVGVYSFGSKMLTWMDPGTGLDHDPVWSPDGKQIAFIREVPIVSPIADRWMREGAPWSIRVANVQTGSGRELWHADSGPGSLFHGVAAKDQLLWMRDGAIVFPWEKTGFVQLWRTATGQAVGTPPMPVSGSVDAGRPHGGASKNDDLDGSEVDSVASDGQRILWSSNAHQEIADDVDRRHLWLATPGDKAPPRPVSEGREIETSPAMLSDGGIAFLQGHATEPLAPVLLSDPKDQSTHALTLGLKPNFVFRDQLPASISRFVKPEAVSFAAADGLNVRGQLFLPRWCDKALTNVDHAPCAHLPAVVFFHGGSRRQMLLGFHPMQYYAQAYEFNQYLAARGFVVLSVNYRSGTGYGLNFRQALNYGANGSSEDSDVVGAAKFLQSRREVDPHRIGAWGGSYGGYLTALALARHSDLYAAGVDLHGVHDWSLELDLWKPTDEPGVDQAAIARRAFASSPMANLDTWKSPVLLMQGDDDRNVLFAQTVRLAAELRRRGVHVEEKIFPDEVHDFLLHRDWITAYQLAAEFLERTLSGPQESSAR